MLQLLVGLGNPGAEYAGTRHNAGFIWLETLAARMRVQLQLERRFKGLAARLQFGTRSVYVLEPQTFMNLSGQSVAALARFYKIPPEDILIVHDEMDLPPGQVKLKHGGGHAGHNGLRDIQAQLGSSATWRLRIGVGHPGTREEVISWVLGRPSPADREAMELAMQRSLDALPDLIAGRVDRATQAIHRGNHPQPSAAEAR